MTFVRCVAIGEADKQRDGMCGVQHVIILFRLYIAKFK